MKGDGRITDRKPKYLEQKKNSSVSLCSPQILYDGQVAMAKNFIDFRSDLCKQTNKL